MTLERMTKMRDKQQKKRRSKVRRKIKKFKELKRQAEFKNDIKLSDEIQIQSWALTNELINPDLLWFEPTNYDLDLDQKES